MAFSFWESSITWINMSMFLITEIFEGSDTGRERTSEIKSESRTTVMSGGLPAGASGLIYASRT